MAALDRRAEEWIAILDNNETDDETGEPVYSSEQKDRIAGRLKDWLKERKRLFPEEQPREGAGVATMREWLNSPEGAQTIEQALRKIHGGSAPATGPTAPAARKPRDKSADLEKAAAGSALHKLVFEGEGLEEADHG